MMARDIDTLPSCSLLETRKFAVIQISTQRQPTIASIANQVSSETKSLFNLSDTSFRANMESSLIKCRDTRTFQQQDNLLKHGYLNILDICHPSFHQLIVEQDFSYDATQFPFGEAFAEMLGICSFSELSTLHHYYHGDRGNLKNRDEKRKLFTHVLDPIKRFPFQQVYLSFILQYIAPHVYNITGCKKLYFQLFPCIRVVRPSEFSIGPHCDAAYGFSQANINFYIPLTHISGTKSLFLESSPGVEDWHTIELSYGFLKRFWGAQCAHFTVANETQETRVSLDFRVIEERYWIENHDQFTSTPGYYASCSLVDVESITAGTNNNDSGGCSNSSNSNILSTHSDISAYQTSQQDSNGHHHWILDNHYSLHDMHSIPAPDFRNGFPFEKNNTKNNSCNSTNNTKTKLKS